MCKGFGFMLLYINNITLLVFINFMKNFFKNSLLKIIIFVFSVLFLFNTFFINNIKAQTVDPISDPLTTFTKVINDYKDINNPKNNKGGN